MGAHRTARRAMSLLIATGLLTFVAWSLPPRGEAAVRGGLEITQEADNESPVPGLTVTNTITARNAGAEPLTGATVRADLTRTLDDAAYNGDAVASTGAVSYSAPVLSWKGDVPAGGTVTITYTVTVDDPDEGDHEMAAAVDAPGSSCTGDKPCIAKALVARLLDYGDAPASFDGGADGPSHTYSTKLGIGMAKSSDGADSDDAEADSDEGDDGVRAFPEMASDMSEYAVEVAVTNATTTDATLAGWIDLNGDGDFDEDERALARVPVGATSATLKWAGLKGVKGERTYVRLRLFQGLAPGLRKQRDLTVTPTGFGGLGEVEDYMIIIILRGKVTGGGKQPPVLFQKTANLSTAKPGAVVTYTIRVVNNDRRTRELGFEDSLGDVLDDAVFLTKSVTKTSGTVRFRRPLLTWSGRIAPHKSATITYKVQLRTKQGVGDGELENHVLSTDVGQNCGLGSKDGRCYAFVYRAKKSRPSGRSARTRSRGTGCRRTGR